MNESEYEETIMTYAAYYIEGNPTATVYDLQLSKVYEYLHEHHNMPEEYAHDVMRKIIIKLAVK